MHSSPGTYLRQMREAASLTIDDVALATETTPPVCARVRAEWLAAIEADTAPIAIATLDALERVFPFERQVLDGLIAADAQERAA